MYQSVYRKGVRRHKDSVHLHIKHGCDECDKKYGDPYDLKAHKQSAHKGIFYTCEQCNKAYSQKKGLMMHEKEHQGVI